MTPDAISKLDYAFSLGCTDIEACLFANVSKSAFYRYLEKNPEYKERKEELKHTPIFKARKTVVDSIDKGDDVSARWYLERKKADEFRQKQDVDIRQTGSLTIEERSDALSAFLRRFTPSGDTR